MLIVELDHGRWFSSVIPASSTAKAGRHDIAEILLKVALNTNCYFVLHRLQLYMLHRKLQLLVKQSKTNQ
jgi:hypothetical protein